MDPTESASVSTNSISNSDEQLICETKDDEYLLNDYLFEGVHQESAQRSLLLSRRSFQESFGFALQSYVFRRTASNTFERVTYVDYVQANSPADRCGVIKGDMVVAVNEKSVVTASHAEIVDSIAQCLQVSLVLVFKNVAKIVELSVRSIQLRCVIEAKTRELRMLEEREKQLVGSEELENGVSSRKWWPYRQSNLTGLNFNFNKKLSAVRVKIENFFGVLTSKFQVFDRALKLSPLNSRSLIVALSIVHNLQLGPPISSGNTSELPSLIDPYDTPEEMRSALKNYLLIT